MNVLRYQGIANFMSSQFKSAIAMKMQSIFKDEELSKQLEEQGPETLIKILSDIVFFTNTAEVAKKLSVALDKQDVVVNLGNLLKMTEHVAESDNGLETNERLLRSIESYLRKGANLTALTTH